MAINISKTEETIAEINKLTLTITQLEDKLTDIESDFDEILDRNAELQNIGRNYLDKYTRERGAHEKTKTKLDNTRNDLLTIVRLLSLNLKDKE